MSKTKKNLLIICLTFITVFCLSFAFTLIEVKTAKAISYNSTSFTEDFSIITDIDKKLYTTENITVKNGVIESGNSGRGLVVGADTIVETNMGYGEFDMYLTLSDDNISGDPNNHGAKITFANGNDVNYTFYLPNGSSNSVGAWFWKGSNALSDHWVMIDEPDDLAKYKIEVREGYVAIKFYLNGEYVFIHDATGVQKLEYELESSEISNVSGYITIERAENVLGMFILNDIKIVPLDETANNKTAQLDVDNLQLGSSGYVNASVELNKSLFNGVFINGNKLEESKYLVTVEDGVIKNVRINKEVLAYEYGKKPSKSIIDISIISRDDKFVAKLPVTVGLVNVRFINDNDEIIKSSELPVGTKLSNISLDETYSGFATKEERVGVDGVRRKYLTKQDLSYYIYKDVDIYCLSEEHLFNVYLFTYDNFSYLNDAEKVLVPYGWTITEYLSTHKIEISNPYGKFFTGWDFNEPILEDMDICAEYYTLKGNGKDLEIKFDKEPSPVDMNSVVVLQNGGSVSYENGMANIVNPHVWTSLLSTQVYTDFEYSFDLKKYDNIYTDDWSFSFSFGIPNHDIAQSQARKFSVSFKNSYNPDDKTFDSAYVIFEGGNNIDDYSFTRIVGSGLMKTNLFTSAAVVIGGPYNTSLDKGCYRFNSGLNEEDYVSFKVRVVDKNLTLYTKHNGDDFYNEEFSYQLNLDTTGYIAFFQPGTERMNNESRYSVDNFIVKNLANERHEIKVDCAGETYSTPQSALFHEIGENVENNNIVFNYNSRFQSFVGTRYSVYNEDWSQIVASGVKDFSLESYNGQILARELTIRNEALAELYNENLNNVYSNNKLNIVIYVLTESDYAEIYITLSVLDSYTLKIAKSAQNIDNSELIWVGSLGASLDILKITEYFADFSKAQVGYKFVGWKDVFEGTIYSEDNNLIVSKNLILVPYFEIASYTVKFVDKDGTVYDTKTVLHGQDCELPTFIPESDDGKFLKWADNYKNVTSNIEVLAEFENSSNGTIWWIVGACGVVLIVSVSLFVLTRKRKDKKIKTTVQ